MVIFVKIHFVHFVILTLAIGFGPANPDEARPAIPGSSKEFEACPGLPALDRASRAAGKMLIALGIAAGLELGTFAHIKRRLYAERGIHGSRPTLIRLIPSSFFQFILCNCA